MFPYQGFQFMLIPELDGVEECWEFLTELVFGICDEKVSDVLMNALRHFALVFRQSARAQTQASLPEEF